MFELFLKGVFLTTVLFLTLVLLSVAKNGAQGTDFISFYTGALIVRNGEGGFLYDEKTQEEYQKPFSQNLSVKLLPYCNLPFVALFFIPFTLIPFDQAYILLGFLNIGAVLFIAYLASRIFINIKQPVFFFLASLLYWPVVQSFILGQVSLVLALVFLLVYYFIKINRYFLAGLFLGLVLIKPQYLLVAPFIFLVVRKKNLLAGFFATFLMVFLLNFFVSGFWGLKEYPYFILKTETAEYGSRFWNFYTLNAFFQTIKVQEPLAIFVPVLLYFIILLQLTIKKRGYNLEKAFVIISVTGIVFSAHSLVHDLVILLPSIFILANRYIKPGSPNRIFGLLFLLALFLLPPVSEITGISAWSSLVLLSVSAFFILMVKSTK